MAYKICIRVYPKKALGDYRVIITSSAANQRSEFSIITYVIILNIIYYTLYIIYFIFKKYKTFSVLIYSYINTSGNWKIRPLGVVFPHNFEFFQSTRKMFYIFFYNIASTFWAIRV